MTESVPNRSDILKQLTTEHPAACGLMVELVKAIDYERRTSELATPHPDEEVVTFDLVSLDSTVGATLENLSMNDATTVEFDHAARVLRDFFGDLASEGFALQSQALTSNQTKDLTLKQLEVGVEVELKDPVADSSYAQAFTGYVVAIKDAGAGLITVEDLEGDWFDVELNEIASIVD